MLNYWCELVECGEEVIVEAVNEADFRLKCREYFDKNEEVRIIDIVSDEEAEMMGIDTY